MGVTELIALEVFGLESLILCFADMPYGIMPMPFKLFVKFVEDGFGGGLLCILNLP